MHILHTHDLYYIIYDDDDDDEAGGDWLIDN